MDDAKPADAIEEIKSAFCNDDARSVRALLERHPEFKARINDPICAFDAPPITSVRSREMLDVLLAAGADINAKSRWWAGGFGLLHGADPELAAYAIERGAIVDVHAAARLGMLEKLRELIEAEPALVHARGGDGQTPLHFASTVRTAEYLLGCGAEIDAQDLDHESAPAQWMVRERPEVARYLVQHNCRTDILMASALGDLGLVQKHLEADRSSIRMNVSEKYFPKKNPRSGGTIYTWTLGASKSAHIIAREFGHEEVFRYLMEQSPDELKCVVACELGDETALRALLNKQLDLFARVPVEDHRKLVDAAQDNNSRAVELMLFAGWPVDARGQHQGTALHWAAFHGNSRMVEIILRSNPPLELTDRDYNATPLGWAIYGSENGCHRKTGDYAGVVELLLKAGARRPEKSGGTPAVQQVLRAHSKGSD
jgi:ankyrin repeat protein